ncbi:hypothetical protein M9458_049853, partial [Cirrhinus mrigala]
RKAVKRHFKTLKAKVSHGRRIHKHPYKNRHQCLIVLNSSDVFEDEFENLPTDAPEPQNDPTDASEPQSSSDVFEDAFENLPTDAPEPQNDPTDASEPQSSSDVFEDEF